MVNFAVALQKVLKRSTRSKDFMSSESQKDLHVTARNIMLQFKY